MIEGKFSRLNASAGVREALESKLLELDAYWSIHGGPFGSEWVSEVLSALSDHGVQESAGQTSIARKLATEATSDSATEFSSLQEANIARQKEWDPDNRITLAYRGNELAGEVGEACNVIKKLERERLGINGSRDTVEHLLEELADSVICSYLVAMHVGGDLEAAIVAKFNATSEKMGLKTRMRFTKSDGGVEVTDTQKPEISSVEFRGKKSLEALPGSCASTADATALRSSAGVVSGPSDSLLSKTLTEGEKQRPQKDGSRANEGSQPSLTTDADLLALLDRARNQVMTPDERYEQRRSFLRGMCPSHRDYADWCAQVDKHVPPLDAETRRTDSLECSPPAGFADPTPDHSDEG